MSSVVFTSTSAKAELDGKLKAIRSRNIYIDRVFEDARMFRLICFYKNKTENFDILYPLKGRGVQSG